MTSTPGPHDRQQQTPTPSPRQAIEGAIAILKANQAALTEGQIKEIKRIIYASPHG